MYTIVDIAGKQFKVAKAQHVYTPRIDAPLGASVNLDKVLLFAEEEKVEIGTPTIVGAQVTAKVLEHGKSDKIIVFKKKRRKGYTKRQGHRQAYTKLGIEDITKT